MAQRAITLYTDLPGFPILARILVHIDPFCVNPVPIKSPEPDVLIGVVPTKNGSMLAQLRSISVGPA